jgi:hypothetical protein
MCNYHRFEPTQVKCIPVLRLSYYYPSPNAPASPLPHLRRQLVVSNRTSRPSMQHHSMTCSLRFTDHVTLDHEDSHHSNVNRHCNFWCYCRSLASRKGGACIAEIVPCIKCFFSPARLAIINSPPSPLPRPLSTPSFPAKFPPQ